MDRFQKIILVACAFLVFIRLVGSLFPEQRLWGVNLLYYVPSVWRWILVISGLVILIPRVNTRISDSLSVFHHGLAARLTKINRYYRYVFISLIGGILFWALRVRTFLLGDSFLRAGEINQGAKFSFTAPLDFLLHVKVARLLNWDAFQTYAVLSVLSGAVFLFLILSLRDRIARDKTESLLIFCVIATMGANQLFFGYVESYTLVYVAIIAYILVCLGYLANKNGLVLPVTLFFVALALHLSALTLLPSLLYLISLNEPKRAETQDKRPKSFKALLSIGVVLSVGAGLFILQSYNPDKKGLAYFLIYPLGSGETFYSLFSPSHLLDLVNHQLLISPVGVLILLAPLLAFSKSIKLKDRTVGFLLILSVCTLAYAFLIDPKLGYPRDWDLFAFSGLGYTVLGLYVFLKYWRETKADDLRYVTLSLLVVSLISTVPWIYINATHEKAVARFEHLLDLDEKRSAYGRENLAMYYSRRQEWHKEIEQWKKAIALTNNARYMTNLAVVYYNQRRYDLALMELERSLEADSTFDFTHFLFAEILLRAGRHEQAIEEYRKAIKCRSDITQYYDNLGALLANLGRYQEAVDVFEQGLKANPEYPSIYRNLGYTYLNMGDFSQARRYLMLYLEQSPKADDRAEINEVLRNLRNKRPEQPKGQRID